MERQDHGIDTEGALVSSPGVDSPLVPHCLQSFVYCPPPSIPSRSFVLYSTLMEIRACGCIPFRRTRERELVVLMILRRGGFWEFPKGKQEDGESDEATALRELREETGLVGQLTEEDPIVVHYTFTRDGVRTNKAVRYFFCRVPDAAAVTPEKREVNDYAWLPLEAIVDRATYPEMKEVARQVWQLLGD